jgi:hypothetical protein
LWFKVFERVRLARLRRRYGLVVATVPRVEAVRLPRIDLVLAEDLPPTLRVAADGLRREADQILGGCMDVLGSGPRYVGSPPDWHLDFKSGFRWPSRFYPDVEVTRLDDDSDAKVPWELSRSHHILTLARAATLFDDRRYANAAFADLESWLVANPPGIGINWTNPMEVGIRAINWLWALATLDLRFPVGDVLRSRLTESLQIHARHIRGNLEGTPLLRSNHYLADIVALLALGYALPDDPSAAGWVRYARTAIERESQSQILPDGVGFEGSTSYHALALELFLVAVIVARQAGDPIPTAVRDRIYAMAEASRGLRHPSGRVPQFGDSDSGRILPGCFKRDASHDAHLWLASAVVGAHAPDGEPHAEVAWTLGLSAWEQLDHVAASPPPISTFIAGGLYVLRAEGVHLVVRTGDVGQNGNGGHAHNDLLSYELSLEGTPIVVDPGTYAYTSEVAARNAFRSSRSHNVLIVDEEEINPLPAASIFRLPQVATATVESLTDSSLVASHDGYERLQSPVSVIRQLTVKTAGVGVVDCVTGTGSARVRSFIHLSPELRVLRRGAATFLLTGVDLAVSVSVEGADSVDVEEGWVSPEFGVRVVAPVIVASASAELPAEIGYSFGLVRSGDEAQRLFSGTGS